MVKTLELLTLKLETKDVCTHVVFWSWIIPQRSFASGKLPCRHHLRMAQIPEQPELERPKTTPGTRDGSQSLSTRGFKSMKTAGTVKFQSTSGSGPLGATRFDKDSDCKNREDVKDEAWPLTIILFGVARCHSYCLNSMVDCLNLWGMNIGVMSCPGQISRRLRWWRNWSWVIGGQMGLIYEWVMI